MRLSYIRQRTVALGASESNAAISFGGMTAGAVVVGLQTERGLFQGLGFDSYGRYAHAGLLEERFIPRVLAAGPELLAGKRGYAAALALREALLRDEKAGGHGERAGAVGLLETALWDALAKSEGLPLWALLEREYGHPQDAGPPPGQTAVYASGGHYRAGVDERAVLRAEASQALEAGYGWFKLKVGGAAAEQDDARVAAVVEAVGDPGLVAVDANCAFIGPAGLDRVAQLAARGVRWIEEPLDPLDHAGHATLSQLLNAPIATGENLFSVADVANLLRHGGLRPGRDVLQMDIGLSYGITEFVQMLNAAEAAGWSRRDFIPHAGHQLALHAAAGLGLGGHETASAAGSPFSGVSTDTRVDGGIAHLGDCAGAGIEFKPALYRHFEPLL